MKKHINSISNIPVNTQFIALVNSSYSKMGDDYGPPDPPPTMETYEEIQVISFDSEDSLSIWIKENSESRSKKVFQILKYTPVKVSTEIKLIFS
jgi:hypothetical protein